MVVICDVCKALGIFQEPAAGTVPPESNSKPSKRRIKKSHATMKDLHLSAVAGCKFCTRIWAGFKEETCKYFDIEAEEDTLAEVSIDFQARHEYDQNGLEGFILTLGATYQLPGSDGSYHGRYFSVRLYFAPAMISPEGVSRFEKSPAKDFDEALERVKQALPYQNVGIWPEDSTRSESSWRLARTWLTKCLLEHSECPPDLALQAWHPTRLLHIKDNNPLSIHLVTGDKIPKLAKYFTLSHCWGKNQIIRLLQNNIEQFKQTVPVNQLSTTFRECMEFASSTEIQYVWIDSLCIIQDSGTDKQEQFPLMSKVYPCAICNIAANNSSDGSGGLFRPREVCSVMPLYLAIDDMESLVNRPKKSVKSFFKKSFKPFSSTTMGFYVLIGNGELWRTEILGAPLSKRAWVFQEYLLARRTIHFGANQLFFECCRDKYCETYASGLPPQLMYRADFATHNKRMKQPLVLYEFEEKSHPLGAFFNWGQMVCTYTSLELTVPSDKLPAISGVAQEYQKVTKSRYIAGMWEDTLLSQLLWRATYFVKRPDEYRAPTWSWASVDGEVDADTFGELTMATWSGREEIHETLSTTVLANIVEAYVSLEDDRIETGRVKSGFLRIRGRLIPVSFNPGCDDDHNPGILNFSMPGEDWGLIYVDVDPRNDSLDGHFFCVPLSREGPGTCKCVLLHATGKARGQFERFGIFEGHEGSTRYFCEEQGRVESTPLEEEFYLEKIRDGDFYAYEFDIV